MGIEICFDFKLILKFLLVDKNRTGAKKLFFKFFLKICAGGSGRGPDQIRDDGGDDAKGAER